MNIKKMIETIFKKLEPKCNLEIENNLKKVAEKISEIRQIKLD